MLAKHYGKREDVLGKQTVEEEKSTCQKPQTKDGEYHDEDHNITSDQGKRYTTNNSIIIDTSN